MVNGSKQPSQMESSQPFELGLFPPTLPLHAVTDRVSRRLAPSAWVHQPLLPQLKEEWGHVLRVDF